MSAYTPAGQEDSGTSDRIEGPIPGVDRFGAVEYTYYRCRRCGDEAARKRDLDGCCR
jgi:hypothetical protein